MRSTSRAGLYGLSGSFATAVQDLCDAEEVLMISVRRRTITVVGMILLCPLCLDWVEAADSAGLNVILTLSTGNDNQLWNT